MAGSAHLEGHPNFSLKIPAMSEALTEIVHVGFLKTNDHVSGNPFVEPLVCLREWIKNNEDILVNRFDKFLYTSPCPDFVSLLPLPVYRGIPPRGHRFFKA